MPYIETNPQTFWREEFEADTRDFVAENTIWTPSKQELKDLPKSIRLTLSKTYDQWSSGACTAFGLTHVQLFQNEKEFDSNIELDPWSLWINMWHNPANKNDRWDYLENALKASKDKWITGKLPTGKSNTFLTNSYAYKSFGELTDNDYNIMKHYLSKWMPIYTAMKWTNKTWKEMLAGEVVTVFGAWDTTGWHAIAIFWIDEEYVYFYNSWSPIRPATISEFKISRKILTQMRNSGMLNWRYWLVYDKKDIVVEPLFEDYYKDENTEEYKAVKWCKENGLIKWSNWKLLPNQPLTREQMALILYRFATFIAGWRIKEENVTIAKPTVKQSKPKSGWSK